MKQEFVGPLAAARRLSIAAALLLPFVMASAEPAAAVTACTTVNGTNSLPGTSLGTISGSCTIGNFSNPASTNSSPANVSPTFNPSIYSFTWGGGVLSIQVETGNNGVGFNIDFELGLASGNSLNADKSLASKIASVFVPWDNVVPTGGPNGPVYLIQNMNLAAGTYVLDTYLGSCGNPAGCSGTFASDLTDPNYMMNFVATGSGTEGTTPLPAALPLFAAGLGGFGLVGWRRKKKAAA